MSFIVVEPTWERSITGTHFDWEWAHVNTRAFAFCRRFKVVYVATAATISERLALGARCVVKPTGNCSVTGSDYLGKLTNVTRSTLAAFTPAARRGCEVVPIAAATTVREAIALAALTVEKPTRDNSVAGADYLGKHTHVTLSILAATVLAVR